jgi:hypothetical protein
MKNCSYQFEWQIREDIEDCHVEPALHIAFRRITKGSASDDSWGTVKAERNQHV